MVGLDLVNVEPTEPFPSANREYRIEGIQVSDLNVRTIGILSRALGERHGAIRVLMMPTHF